MATPPNPDIGGFEYFMIRQRVKLHCLLYRLTGGRRGGLRRRGDRVSPILLLTTLGRKTGKRRTTPVNCIKTEHGWAIAATFAGSDRNPAWYLNLTAVGEADIQVMERKMHARAETVTGERRAALWALLVDDDPNYATYQSRTRRQIPVVELVPV
jgi:deazaflavin-dependent oxidoreductase (nitroreductase family)